MTTGKEITPRADPLTREILLAFWKVHILHHAGEGAIYGQWIADELGRHGYKLSPGTLYPLLKRMERHGWLRSGRLRGRGPHARKEYRLTGLGARVLALVRDQVRELHGEVAGTTYRS